MEKVKYFEKELTYIKNERIKNSGIYLINHLPDYFFEIPASSTGKYHPKYALGEKGLLRHTKVAVRIAYELLINPIIGNKYTNDEKDIMILSLIIHDGLKSGKIKNKYTMVDHPLLIASLVEEEKNNLSLNNEEIILLKNVVSSHMGPWNKDYDGNEVLPVPKSKYESFVHMCDYLASRKCILIAFDENNEVID